MLYFVQYYVEAAKSQTFQSYDKMSLVMLVIIWESDSFTGRRGGCSVFIVNCQLKFTWCTPPAYSD